MSFSTEIAQVVPRLTTTQSPHRYRRIYQWSLLTGDACMLILAFALAYWLRFGAGVTISPEVTPSAEQYMRLIVVLVPLWLSLFALMRLYDYQFLLGGITEYARAFNACTSGMMIVVITSFIEPEFVIARGWLVMSWLLAGVLVSSGRFFLRRAVYFLRQKGYFVTPTVIVGTNEEAIALTEQLQHDVNSGLSIVGFVTESELSNEQSYLGKFPILGTLDKLPELVSQKDIGEVVIATTALSREQLLNVSLKLTDLPQVQMRLSSGLYEVLTTGMQVSTMGSVPLMSLNRLRLNPFESFLKTIMDYMIILLSTLVLLPIFSVLALLIKLDSPGPIFYRRRVIGLEGKEFDAFKFRTMFVNGDEVLDQHPELKAQLAAEHKLKDDPRITRVGNWLRRTSLDELPQLINVLLGQMSLVGPRMISPAETKEYGKLRLNLFTVKPGLTGLWQVSGRSNLSYDDRVRLDMHYIRNYSIWQDLQILFVQTLPAVVKGRGAY